MKVKGSPSSLLAMGIVWLAVSTVSAEVREWTRASDGKKIPAEFVGLKDEATVKIKTARGQIFEVPLENLSEEDKAYVKVAVAKNAPLPEGETTVTLAGVHLCCASCVEAIEEIGSGKGKSLPKGVVITADRSANAIVVKAPNGKDAQAALLAVVEAGFYGTSDDPAVAIPEIESSDATSDTMEVRNVHLCCGGCVRPFTKAVESVDGVESCDAKNGATTVTVKGKGFKPGEVMKALREAGFGGTSR